MRRFIRWYCARVDGRGFRDRVINDLVLIWLFGMLVFGFCFMGRIVGENPDAFQPIGYSDRGHP